MKKINYRLSNIDCAACATKIEDKLNRLIGMHFCTLNFITQKLTVLYDEEVLTEDKIETTIKRAVYGVIINDKTNLQVTEEDMNIPIKEDNKIKTLIFGKKKIKN